jgi:hypothetical protein
VPDRVQHDVGDVFVGEGVLDLACLAVGRHDARGAQHAQVLGDQRLANPESGNKLVHTPAACSQLTYDAQPHGRRKRLQQFGGCLKGLSRGRCHMRKLAYCD